MGAVNDARLPAVLPLSLLLLCAGCAPATPPPPVPVTGEACLHDAQCGFALFAAHRGKCGDVQEPENSLAAYLACESAGVPLVEVDVRVTADGQVVLNHDSDYERTTDVAAKFPGRTAVSALTLAETKTLVVNDARCAGATPDSSRCRIITLGELIDAAPKLAFFIDYKAGALEPFFDAVRARCAERRVPFFDSSLHVLRAVHAALPAAALMPRVASTQEALTTLDTAGLPITWIHGDPPYVKELAPQLEARGVRLYANVWHLDAEFLIVEGKSPEEIAAHAERTVYPRLRALLADGLAGVGTEYSSPMARALYPAGWGLP
jgi:hypothetical protein